MEEKRKNYISKKSRTRVWERGRTKEDGETLILGKRNYDERRRKKVSWEKGRTQRRSSFRKRRDGRWEGGDKLGDFGGEED